MKQTLIISNWRTVDYWTLNGALIATVIATVVVLARKKYLSSPITAGDVMAVLVAKAGGALLGLSSYFLFRALTKDS
jgi:hypothetical protein